MSAAGLVRLLLAYRWMKFKNFGLPQIFSLYLNKKAEIENIG
jgi:hypothetical protein